MIKIRFIQATMTALIEALHHAYATGNLRAVKRISALLDVAKDESVENVARKYDVARQTVHRWVTELLLAGLDSLKYEKSSGRKPRLTKAQKARLKEVVKAGPPAAGFQTACWTSLLIQMVIYREFKVFYSRHYVCELLHNLGFSFQKARFVSDHLDEKRRREWMEKEWPKILRQAKKRRAYLLKVLAETTRQLVIIQEGARYHTSKAMRQFFAAHQDRITGYQLPSYSPDYNPIEYLWKNVKREATHNQYFPEFELLTLSVDQALAYYAQHPGEVKVGDVFLQVPMVDQGPKGYCAPATLTRVVQYYGHQTTMNEMAAMMETQGDGGTLVTDVLDGVRKVTRRLRLSFKEEDLPGKDKLDNQRRLDRWVDTAIIAYIDNGNPIFWTVPMHQRLIIGYNAATREILSSDSWGQKGYDRMPYVEAAKQTEGIWIIR